MTRNAKWAWIVSALGVLLAACSSSGRLQASDAGRVDEATYVALGGLDQYITIHSKQRTNPVLLIVHGGPGDVQSPFRQEYSAYEDEFTVVQWDQRGAGKTFGRNKQGTPDLNLDRIVDDGVELTEFLVRHLGKRKIYVLGHSWGSGVAAGMVQKRPDLYQAYIGTGQVGSWDRGIRYQRDFVLGKAREAGNQEVVQEIAGIEDFDPGNVRHFLAVGKHLRSHLGPADKAWLSSITERTSAAVSPEDSEDIVEGMKLSGPALFPDQVGGDLFASANRFSVPVYVIQGSEDLFTPTPVAREYFESLSAPAKAYHSIEGAGHFALLTHQGEFIRILRGIVDGGQPR